MISFEILESEFRYEFLIRLTLVSSRRAGMLGESFERKPGLGFTACVSWEAVLSQLFLESDQFVDPQSEMQHFVFTIYFSPCLATMFFFCRK